MVVVARQVLSLVAGGAIDEWLLSNLLRLRQEHTLARALHLLQQQLWPGGAWFQTLPEYHMLQARPSCQTKLLCSGHACCTCCSSSSGPAARDSDAAQVPDAAGAPGPGTVIISACNHSSVLVRYPAHAAAAAPLCGHFRRRLHPDVADAPLLQTGCTPLL